MEINYIDQRPEISIVDDTVILSLTLQDNAASTAINAANEAEASALAAGLSEQNAFDSEQAAAQSETNAAGSATAASQSASNALASEQNAAQSETNAATSASTATTQAGIATTKASEASQSATDALASAQAAAASELDAEAARDEIVSKIDFTGAQEGDIYRVNSAGVAVKINETEFLKSKVPFQNSPLFALNGGGEIYAWDNSFGKPNQNPRTLTDSGHSYVVLSGSAVMRVQNQKLSKTLHNGTVVIPCGFGSVSLTAYNRFQPANRVPSYIVAKDANNYIMYQIGVSNITLQVIINGVSNVVFSTNVSNTFSDNFQVTSPNRGIDYFADLTFTVFQSSINQPFVGLAASVRSQLLPFLNRSFDLTPYLSTFQTKSDLAYVGFGDGFTSNNPISSWVIKSVSP